jgi:DNA-directed RNA polymerase specialized sigma24 family protein
MDANESEADSFTLHHAFTDPSEDPATKAARKMDWETFMAMQDECDRAILRCAAEGRPIGHVGKHFRISPTTIRNRTRRIAIAVREFMGENILAEAGRQPQWKEQLMARRQKLSPAPHSTAL